MVGQHHAPRLPGHWPAAADGVDPQAVVVQQSLHVLDEVLLALAVHGRVGQGGGGQG